MRGKLRPICAKLPRSRITPAGAGKTIKNIFYLSDNRDHPRRCGENRNTCGGENICRGSPPQVRGKLPVDLNVIARQRITPAGAGKTRYDPQFLLRAKDHPRRCGENTQPGAEQRLTWGSPPQVRGKRRSYHFPSELVRITPAGAGKTRAGLPAASLHWDHPRRCGENFGLRQGEQGKAGSPPQVRGKLSFGMHMRPKSWITPAGAGKTKRQRCTQR